jgi:hypothetical protein
MNKTYLPHQNLFDELQLSMIPIARDLLVINSLLKWVKSTVYGEDLSHNFAWMLSKQLASSPKKQIELLTSLRQSTRDFATPLKELMRHILEFSSFKPVEKALIALHKSYLEVPQIDNEMHLLYLGTDLFQNKELLNKLLLFTEKLLEVKTLNQQLKKLLIDSLIQNLSFTLERPSKIEFQAD